MKYRKIYIKKLMNEIAKQPKYSLINLPQNVLVAYECIFGIKVDNILTLTISDEQAEHINKLIFTSMELIAVKTLKPYDWPQDTPKETTSEKWRRQSRRLLFHRLSDIALTEYQHFLEIAIHQAFYEQDGHLRKHPYRNRKAKRIPFPKINAIWCMPFSRTTQLRRWFNKEYGAMPEELKAAGIFFLADRLVSLAPSNRHVYARLAMDIERLSTEALANRKYKVAAF